MENEGAAHGAEFNHRALRVSAQHGRNSRKNSADSPFLPTVQVWLEMSI